MKLKDLKALLEHTELELGEDVEIVLQHHNGKNAQQYNFGDQDSFSMWHHTPYDTYMYVDGFKRFVIYIKSVPFPEPTAEMIEADKKYWKNLSCGIAEACKNNP